MQTYLVLSEISLRSTHARLIACRSGAALVVLLVELMSEPLSSHVAPKPLRSLSVFHVRIIFNIHFCIINPLMLPATGNISCEVGVPLGTSVDHG